MKKLTILILAAIMTVSFIGCTEQNAQLGNISLDAAKAAALSELGIDPSKVVFEGLEVKTYNGKEYYEIDFEVDGKDYECNIDALTGAIISIETPEGEKKVETADSTKNEQQTNTEKTAETKTEQKTESKTEQATAQAEKSAESSKVSDNTKVSETKAELIGEEKAKQIALKDAGVAAKDATFVKVHLDRDDGRTEYEVEFYSGNVEYDYDIDAYSGKILSVDRDIENYTVSKDTSSEQQKADKPQGTSQSSTANVIGEAAARKLALAQVPGALDSDIREFETDRDDGRVEYEGKIVYGGVEYEFEIDGHSGAFRKWETEAIYKDSEKTDNDKRADYDDDDWDDIDDDDDIDDRDDDDDDDDDWDDD